MDKKRILLAWSSGKDCVWALHVLGQQGDCEVVGLLATLNADNSRVCMHGIREKLLTAQAEAVGSPLIKVYLPDPCSDEEYGKIMGQVIERARRENISAIAFGDIFLEEVRKYREEKLAGTGIQAIFPLWGTDTRQLAGEIVSAGLGAYITCVDLKQLDSSFAGRSYDAKFLEDLPTGVDPCGENGEFHTFVYQAPGFNKPLNVEPGKIVIRDGFVYADMVEPNRRN
ncbi:MAG: adenine nucleotide alpha hydrolase [Planctomycetota bacterium]|nr:MAG: adenine nucleotide alpha hydrolase [Planctomycetota bacterium]